CLQQPRARALPRHLEGRHRPQRHPLRRPVRHLAQAPEEGEGKMKRTIILAAALAAVLAWTERATAQSATAGHQVFDKWCAPCHGAGLAKPATAALAFKYKGSDTPALLEQRTDLTADFVKSMVRTGVYTMPPFRKTEISDGELDALATYLSKSK